MRPQIAAHSWSNRHPEKLIILFECEHSGKKEKHHPNYDKPFEVELLCSKCHNKREALKIDIDKIENERLKKNITKYRMSKLLKMSNVSYYMICNRQSTRWSTLEKIAKVLNLDPRDLIL